MEDTKQDMMESMPLVWKNAIVCCNFPPPPSPTTFGLDASKGPVRVEKVHLDGSTMVGSVLVNNWAFEKKVVVRWTADMWASYGECEGSWHGVVGDGVERFLFNMNVEDMFVGQAAVASASGIGKVGPFVGKEKGQWKRKVMLFAVRYECGGQSWWDNNDGMNYEVEFVRTVTPPAHPGPLPRPVPLHRPLSSSSHSHGRAYKRPSFPSFYTTQPLDDLLLSTSPPPPPPAFKLSNGMRGRYAFAVGEVGAGAKAAVCCKTVSGTTVAAVNVTDLIANGNVAQHPASIEKDHVGGGADVVEKTRIGFNIRGRYVAPVGSPVIPPSALFPTTNASTIAVSQPLPPQRRLYAEDIYETFGFSFISTTAAVAAAAVYPQPAKQVLVTEDAGKGNC